MKWQHTTRSKQDYNRASSSVKKAFDKRVQLLANNLLHPSLHAKKYDETADVWQARVNRSWQFYFKIDRDTYLITRIVPHPK